MPDMYVRFTEETMDACNEESRHQNNKWGADKQQSFPGFLLLIKAELAEAEAAWLKGGKGRNSACHEMVQVATLALRCLDEYGVVGCPTATNDIRDNCD